MARFQLAESFHVKDRRAKAGQVICDGTSCQTGDLVWTGLNSGTYQPYMVPLDAGATTIKNASKFASVAAPTWITGAHSVDA
jgi:hypothetical protein